MTVRGDNLVPLSLREALSVCEQSGFPMSPSGLRAAALKEDFGRVQDGHWAFSRKGLEAYLADKGELKKPPEGWMTVFKAAAALGLTRQGVYWRIATKRIKSAVYGPGGVIHVYVGGE